MDNEFIGKFTIGQTIDRGVRLYRRGLKRLFLLFLLPGLLGVFNQSWMQTTTGVQWFTSPTGIASFIIVTLVSALLGGYIMIVMVRYLHAITAGSAPSSFSGILKMARPKDLLYILTGILWYAAILLSMLLLVLPGIYFVNIALLVAIPLCVVERRYFLGGIARLFALTKGRWWKTFVINVVTAVVTFVPLMVGYSILMWSMYQGAGGLEKMADPQATAATRFSPVYILGALIYTVIVALVTPLYSAVGIIHYNSLRSEKEHTDLENQLDALPG